MKKLLRTAAVLSLAVLLGGQNIFAQEFYIIGGGGGNLTQAPGGGSGGYTDGGGSTNISNNGGDGYSFAGGGGGGYIGDGTTSVNLNGSDGVSAPGGIGGAGFGGGQKGQDGTASKGGDGGSAVYNGDLHKDSIYVSGGNKAEDYGTPIASDGYGGNATLTSNNITGELHITAGYASTAQVNVSQYGIDANSGDIIIKSYMPAGGAITPTPTSNSGLAILNAGKIYAEGIEAQSSPDGRIEISADYVKTKSYKLIGDPSGTGSIKSIVNMLDVTEIDTDVTLSDIEVYDPRSDSGAFFKNIFIGGGDTLTIIDNNTATNVVAFGFERFNILDINATLNSNKEIYFTPAQTLEFQTKSEYWKGTQFPMLNNNGADISIEDNSSVKVNVTGDKLNGGDSITLIAAGGTGGSSVNGTDGQIWGLGGSALLYDLDLTYTGTQLIATVNDGQNAGNPTGGGGNSGRGTRTNPQAKAYSEGGAAVFALLNDGSDLASSWGIANAVSMTEYTYDFAVFGALSYSKAKYETGSHIDYSGVSVLGGIAKKFVFEPGALTAGVFVEYGSGSFDSENTFKNFSDVKGSGDVGYIGGGLLGRYDFNKNESGESYYYAEGSLRVGSADNTFEADNVGAFSSVKYDADALYYGLHVGVGRIFKLDEKISLDGYGKYFFVHQNGKDADLSTSEPLTFDGMNSHRLRAGARGNYKINEIWSPYLGLAAEYELDGKVGAKVYGMPLDEVEMTGFRGIGEIGVCAEIGNFGADLGIRAFGGQKEGFDAALRLIYFFGKRPIGKPEPKPKPEPVFVLTSADAGQNFFEFDSYELTDHDKKLIAKVAQRFAKEPRLIKMRVDGHTDHVGTEEYNQDLSEKRAQAVANVLTENGIPADKVEVKGYGKSKLIADESEEGMKKNRRVEIYADVKKQQ
ncbi:MAG: OmpA family protein [Endomicrobia bacterium]|nr:OmpA family protein [Endomicrobiia bacterium]